MQKSLPFSSVSVVTEINKNFLIRYYKKDCKNSFLIGAGRYPFLVGDELANKHFNTVLTSLTDKCIFKLRRGLKIVFISK